MKIQKKALAAIAEITNELGYQFDELRAEIDRRFGERRSEGEVFRPLPAPQGMDMSVLTALNERRSQRNFSNEPLPDQLLSNILYAADGINRKGGKRTTATALNWRETDIYVLKANGIWRWVPERNGVLFCSLHDVRDQTYLLQTQLTVRPLSSFSLPTMPAPAIFSPTPLKPLRRKSRRRPLTKLKFEKHASAPARWTSASNCSRSIWLPQP